MKTLEITALTLTIIGAVNWGLVGIGGFLETNLNLVNLIFGSLPALEWIVYILVGLAGLLLLWTKAAKKA